MALIDWRFGVGLQQDTVLIDSQTAAINAPFVLCVTLRCVVFQHTPNGHFFSLSLSHSFTNSSISITNTIPKTHHFTSLQLEVERRDRLTSDDQDVAIRGSVAQQRSLFLAESEQTRSLHGPLFVLPSPSSHHKQRKKSIKQAIAQSISTRMTRRSCSFISAPFLASILLLIAAFIFVAYDVKSGGNATSNSNAAIVSPPMIKMSQYEGPWPKCLGMSGEACVAYIASTATDVQEDNLIIQNIESKETERSFDTNRVLIFVDGDSIVVEVPHRG
eukprot:CAMPEP_0198133348 /NCGR_PEP_ID=MMETSP1442-20131203/59516_1 /TAXON_ID= /ORGANISM="Craspedostauros australis, Strain CCMP3328" /LENGTH=273 /DNA_ID=CAMNT_0043794465 /DNA_START=96 /DNA_END=917 /DNA_ORIENTATION=-